MWSAWSQFVNTQFFWQKDQHQAIKGSEVNNKAVGITSSDSVCPKNIDRQK
jgi:Neuraminidase (sialidase)